MKTIKINVSCQCCYDTYIDDVPDELFEPGKERELSEYINDKLGDCVPEDGYTWLEDNEFTAEDVGVYVEIV